MYAKKLLFSASISISILDSAFRWFGGEHPRDADQVASWMVDHSPRPAAALVGADERRRRMVDPSLRPAAALVAADERRSSLYRSQSVKQGAYCAVRSRCRLSPHPALRCPPQRVPLRAVL